MQHNKKNAKMQKCKSDSEADLRQVKQRLKWINAECVKDFNRGLRREAEVY